MLLGVQFEDGLGPQVALVEDLVYLCIDLEVKKNA